MDEALGHEITQLLQAWRQGDERALEKLTPQVYRELHRAAKGCMARERDGHTLQATALINELYLRLSDLKLIDWQNRAHFFALCARQMRRILTDQARARLLAYLKQDENQKPWAFKLSKESFEHRVRGVAHLMMCMPEYQLA